MSVRLSRRASSSRRFDSLEQEVFLNLWRTYDRLRAFEDELFARFDLTPQQYNARAALCSRAEHPEQVFGIRSIWPAGWCRGRRTSRACSTSWSSAA